MARFFFNNQSMLTPLLKGLAVDGSNSERLAETTRRTLLSRPNIEKVIRETDMDLSVSSPEEMEKLLKSTVENITVTGSGKQNIYLISYVNKDPALAKKVVDTLLEMFVENTIGVARSDSSVTERFIEEQISEYEAKLEAAEQRLKEFKQKNIGLMPTEAGGYFSKLQKEEEQLRKAQLELDEAQQKRQELARQLEREKLAMSGQIGSSSEKAAATPYDERIAGMEARLDNLLLQYTDQHPDVISVKSALEQLKKQRDDAIAERQKRASTGEGGVDGPVSEVYKELKIALGTAETNVSALLVRVAEYKNRVDELRGMVNTIPKVEAELARLNRDYSINKANYEGLVKRRESAKISREAEQSVDDIQFKIIDPPVIPVEPKSPNRPLLLSIVLFLGLGLGGALAWYMGQIRSTFSGQRELMEFSQLPVIGSVALVSAQGQHGRQHANTLLFGVATVILFSMYIGLMVAQMLRIDLVAVTGSLIGVS